MKEVSYSYSPLNMEDKKEKAARGINTYAGA